MYGYLVVVALSLWVPGKEAALAYAVVTHAVVIGVNVGLGAAFLLREGLSLGALDVTA